VWRVSTMEKHKADEYREMARRVLAEADKLQGDAKANLLEIASRYDWMADWVERQERNCAAN